MFGDRPPFGQASREPLVTCLSLDFFEFEYGRPWGWRRLGHD
jgi:hypothetical protein